MNMSIYLRVTLGSARGRDGAAHTWPLADSQMDAPCSPGPGDCGKPLWRGPRHTVVRRMQGWWAQPPGTLGWTNPAQAQNVAPECSPAAHWRKSRAECLMTRWIKLGREKRTKSLFIGPTAHKWTAAGASRHTSVSQTPAWGGFCLAQRGLTLLTTMF